MTRPDKQGRLVVISGPSGVGKTSVVKRLLEISELPLQLSVSATTRPRRQGEKDGVDYHYLAVEEFFQRREAAEFLECFEVYGKGYWYGTLLDEVTPRLAAGGWVVLEIDVQGARDVLEKYPDAITIFIEPDSWTTLENRLRGRGTESEEAVARRLACAKAELEAANFYRHRTVNRAIDQAAEDIDDYLRQVGVIDV